MSSDSSSSTAVATSTISPPHGREVVKWAREVVFTATGLSAEATRLSGELRGELRLGAIPTALPLIAEIVGPVLIGHPAIDVTLRTLSADDIAAQVESFAIDAGITYLERLEGSRRLETTPVLQERYVFLTTTGTSRGSTIAWRELHDRELCLLTTEMQNRKIIDATLADVGATARARIQTDSISGFLSFALRGWSCVASEAWLGLNDVPEGVEVLRLTEPDASTPIGIVTRKSDHPSPVITAFVDHWTKPTSPGHPFDLSPWSPGGPDESGSETRNVSAPGRRRRER